MSNRYENASPKNGEGVFDAEPVCSRCKSGPGMEPHSCPYMAEINDDAETLCDCCDDCRHECNWDI